MRMSDRIYAYTVILDGIYKDEDAKLISDAIEMIKGVSVVTPQIATAETYFACDNARRNLGEKIISAVYGVIEEK
jgi:hypothetical protein